MINELSKDDKGYSIVVQKDENKVAFYSPGNVFTGTIEPTMGTVLVFSPDDPTAPICQPVTKRVRLNPPKSCV